MEISMARLSTASLSRASSSSAARKTRHGPSPPATSPPATTLTPHPRCRRRCRRAGSPRRRRRPRPKGGPASAPQVWSATHLLTTTFRATWAAPATFGMARTCTLRDHPWAAPDPGSSTSSPRAKTTRSELRGGRTPRAGHLAAAPAAAASTVFAPGAARRPCCGVGSRRRPPPRPRQPGRTSRVWSTGPPQHLGAPVPARPWR
mmetsp:Transcript_114847/g.365070  ORF Transcript_114847/g.365070 Transcript_114847/m.365070 type:complete len:204 (+) Transcript_114847:1468-2079(+)